MFNLLFFIKKLLFVFIYGFNHVSVDICMFVCMWQKCNWMINKHIYSLYTPQLFIMESPTYTKWSLYISPISVIIILCSPSNHGKIHRAMGGTLGITACVAIVHVCDCVCVCWSRMNDTPWHNTQYTYSILSIWIPSPLLRSSALRAHQGEGYIALAIWFWTKCEET